MSTSQPSPKKINPSSSCLSSAHTKSWTFPWMTLLLLVSIINAAAFRLLFADSIVAFGLFSLTIASLISALLGLTITSWAGIVVLLVYVGGLIVIFAYFLAICPNQIISIKNTLKKYTLMLILTLFSLILSQPLMPAWPSSVMPVPSLYTPFNFRLLILVAAVLFLTLIAVVKIVQLNRGPLRPFKIKSTR